MIEGVDVDGAARGNLQTDRHRTSACLQIVPPDEPDGIAQLISCVNLLGARCGEMPDGIVIDGDRQFDGFDIAEQMPAPVAAAFAVAGLRCMGKTTVNDGAILRRWPRFEEMLKSVCEFRES